jgi:nucleoside-diphosphate-sugar epimerase
MKVAVLGARGFVGSSIASHLLHNHVVTPVTRDTVNLLDPVAVKEYLKTKCFDVIVNCAAVMTNDESLHDARNNLGMFMNFYNNSHLFGKFINTGSGAEFDRSTSIDCVPESDLTTYMPTDSYGWGQNIKSRLCLEKDNFYTIRIFNCFGRGEPATRIFPRFLNQGSMEISNDRYFDYFSIQDLQTIVTHCAETDWGTVKDVNAVYHTKYKISEVLGKFCDLNNLEPNFKVVSASDNNYTGRDIGLEQLSIPLTGLDYGLKNY